MEEKDETQESTEGWHFHRRRTDIHQPDPQYPEAADTGPFHLHRRQRTVKEDKSSGERGKDRESDSEDTKDKDKKGDEESKDDKEGGQEKMTPRRKRLLIIIAFVASLILICAGVLYYLHARHYEDTDDAFIDGHVSQVAPRISGEIESLLVVDNQKVEAGQLLLTIDPRDYEVRLMQAQAQLKQAQAQVTLQEANIAQAQANVLVAQAQTFQADRDVKRFITIDAKAITREQRDNAIAADKSSNARLEAAQKSVDAARAQEGFAEATVKQAEAEVKNAKLQLSYTHIVAPIAGRVTRRTVEVGNVVSAGTPLMAIASNELWVTANFKETQLTHMRAGQKVRIEIDAFPDAKFGGHVDSFQKGTGSFFSTLPAENATGNYVKVVQRVPVKIVFDDPQQRNRYPMAVGLSVIPRVKVH